MIRIGLPLAHADGSWIGGVNYLSNLVQAFYSLPERQIELVILQDRGVPDAILEAFPKTEAIKTSMLTGRTVSRVVGKGLERSIGRNLIFEALLHANNIQALTHTSPPGRRSPIPALTWVPDFQHVHLPQMFSAKQIAQRENGLKEIVDGSSLILVSSEDARTDLIALFPEAAARSRVLKFVSGLSYSGHIPSLPELQTRYHLSELYFHLPNQFWVHKNHTLAVEALAILAQRGIKAQVICTGHTDDFRNPGYFQKFKANVHACDLVDQIKILGVVPYADLRALMYHSIAVINPSRFEGWSTSVEESKSLGKRILLSDIAVHREQSPDRSSYFGVDDPASLADHMEEALELFSTRDEQHFTEAAAQQLPLRVMEFGKEFHDILLELTKSARK